MRAPVINQQRNRDRERIRLWDKVWSHTSISAPHDSVIWCINALPGMGAVLEVGAGSGRDLEELARLGYDVFYTDVSAQAAHRFGLRLPGAKEVICDGRHLPFCEGSFDLVYSLGLLEHFPEEERRQLLREMFRVSKRLVLIEVPQRYSPATMVKRALMKLGRWKYGDETEFSYWGLVSEVQKSCSQARVFARYGRELVPLPRNFKLPFYRALLPGRLRNVYLALLSCLHFGVAGAFGVVFATTTNE